MRWLAVLALCACGTRPRAVVPEDQAPGLPVPRVPRPLLAFEPFHDDLSALTMADLTWPLTRPPTLEPHAPIAGLYRTTGSWKALCEARRDPVATVDRDEVLDYLLAWCAGVADLDRLRDALRPLAGAKTPLIAHAARLDLVDVVALQRIPAREAARWLQTAFFDRTTLDALAVTYRLLGRSGDEKIIVEMQMTSPVWALAADCRAMYRARRLTGLPWIRDEIEERKPHDAICERVADALDREDPVRHCVLIASHHPKHDGCDTHRCTELSSELRECGALAESSRARLAIAYLHWPDDERDPLVWLAYARFVIDTTEQASVTLATAALDNAALVAGCQYDLPRVLEVVRDLGARAPSPALDYLAKLTPSTCNRRYSPTLGN